jgi:hypothetical protein
VKQFSAVISVICKTCQAGKQYSAVNPVIFKTGKRFCAITLDMCKVTEITAENCFTV